jgi:rhodanese-related sulfurtransferase
MSVPLVSPEEAKTLLDEQGYVYVDVRSIPEFEAGHPLGAYNVPIAHLGERGMTPNREFLDVMQKRFAKESKLVVGCKAGGRSQQAAMVLRAAGFVDVVVQRAGFDGMPGEPGWRARGLPVGREAAPDHGYEDLAK